MSGVVLSGDGVYIQVIPGLCLNNRAATQIQFIAPLSFLLAYNLYLYNLLQSVLGSIGMVKRCEKSLYP